jgi:hypothetical protein
MARVASSKSIGDGGAGEIPCSARIAVAAARAAVASGSNKVPVSFTSHAGSGGERTCGE